MGAKGTVKGDSGKSWGKGKTQTTKVIQSTPIFSSSKKGAGKESNTSNDWGSGSWGANKSSWNNNQSGSWNNNSNASWGAGSGSKGKGGSKGYWKKEEESTGWKDNKGSWGWKDNNKGKGKGKGKDGKGKQQGPAPKGAEFWEEKMQNENRIVLEAMPLLGTVVFYKFKQGWGFIQPDNPEELPAEVQEKIEEAKAAAAAAGKEQRDECRVYFRISDIEEGVTVNRESRVLFSCYVDDLGCGACNICDGSE